VAILVTDVGECGPESRLGRYQGPCLLKTWHGISLPETQLPFLLAKSKEFSLNFSSYLERKKSVMCVCVCVCAERILIGCWGFR